MVCVTSPVWHPHVTPRAQVAQQGSFTSSELGVCWWEHPEPAWLWLWGWTQPAVTKTRNSGRKLHRTLGKDRGKVSIREQSLGSLCETRPQLAALQFLWFLCPALVHTHVWGYLSTLGLSPLLWVLLWHWCCAGCWSAKFVFCAGNHGFACCGCKGRLGNM